MKFHIKVTCVTASIIIGIFLAVRIIVVLTEGESGRLKRTIYKAKSAAERENLVGFTKYISPRYSDELGNDRRMLLLTAKSLFDDYRNIIILIDTMEIEVNGIEGTASIDATVYWRENDSSVIIHDTAKVEAKFLKERKQWKLIELKFLEAQKRRFFNPMIS